MQNHSIFSFSIATKSSFSYDESSFGKSISNLTCKFPLRPFYLKGPNGSSLSTGMPLP